MQKAVNYYLEHGRSIRRTVRILGYPSRTLLAQWIAELASGDRKARITHGAMVQFSQEQKKDRGSIKIVQVKHGQFLPDRIINI